MRRTVLPVLLLATVLVGCAARANPVVDDGSITMDNLAFGTELQEIHLGDRLTFSNASSRALHVLVVGKDAQPRSEPGAPSFGGASGHRAEVGDRWTTPPWTTTGTFHVTCTLHPSMNLKVVVSSEG